MIDIIKKLASVADSLDEKGLYNESTFIDSIIQSISKEAKKAKKDFDGDGELESSEDEWKGSRDKAIKSSKGKKSKGPKAKKPKKD